MTEGTFDPGPMLEVLNRHHVQYVVIGGYAAQIHGSSRPTTDLDVTPGMDGDNLSRLAAALRDLDAHIRVPGIDEGLPWSTDATALAGLQFANLTTAHGDLDISFHPAGTDGYGDLVRSAATRYVGDVQIQVASLEDIIRSKTAAARPKDERALPELEDLLRRSDTEQAPPAPPRADAGRRVQGLPERSPGKPGPRR